MAGQVRDSGSEEAIRRVCECMGRPDNIRVLVPKVRPGVRGVISVGPICYGCDDERLCTAMRGAACRELNRARDEMIRDGEKQTE
jgi:hypothetical protein